MSSPISERGTYQDLAAVEVADSFPIWQFPPLPPLDFLAPARRQRAAACNVARVSVDLRARSPITTKSASHVVRTRLCWPEHAECAQLKRNWRASDPRAARVQGGPGCAAVRREGGHRVGRARRRERRDVRAREADGPVPARRVDGHQLLHRRPRLLRHARVPRDAHHQRPAGAGGVRAARRAVGRAHRARARLGAQRGALGWYSQSPLP